MIKPQHAILLMLLLAVGGSIVVATATNTSTATTCFQESADESNACGGLGTGSYAASWCTVAGTCSSAPELWTNCVDGRSDKPCETLQGGSSNRTLDLRINYTKPPGDQNTSRWLVTAQNTSWGIIKPTTFTVQIPAGCFAQQPLQFRYQDHSFMHEGHCFDAGTKYSCYNGTSWQPLNNPKIGFGKPHGDQCLTYERGIMYEEAMSWTIQS